MRTNPYDGDRDRREEVSTAARHGGRHERLGPLEVRALRDSVLAPGLYDITLTVTGSGGNTDVDHVVVRVTP